jgi:molybdopterin-guanine dinucleotide biosynthesis protein A
LDIGGIVLAGGCGLRLGRDKASEIVGPQSLLEWVLSRLDFLSGEILLVTAGDMSGVEIPGYPHVRVVSDIYPGKGPLGGIYTGLRQAAAPYNLVVACDMPFLSRALLEYMIDVAGGFDLVLPRVGDLIEPLHAVYSRACLQPMESLLESGRLSVREVLGYVRVRYVEAEEMERFDPTHLSFFNVNTNSDLARAKGLMRGEI